MLASFLKLLRGEEGGRIVWNGDITYWMTGRECDGTADPAWQTEEGYLACHRKLGLMPYYYYPKFLTAEPVFDNTVEYSRETINGVTTQRYRTPLGEIAEESVWAAESCSTGITKHFIETAADLDALRYLMAHRTLVPCNLDDYRERMVLWAEYDGLPSLGMPRSPLSSFLYEWAGVIDGTYLLYDYEDAVRDLFAEMAAQEDSIIDAVCALGPPLLHFADNLSSDNVGSLYAEWLAPMHRRWLVKLHAAGVATVVHLDGTVRGLLPQLAAIGFTGVEALTPKPVGDVSLEEMRAVADSDHLILWGGVPGAMFAPPYTRADMEMHIHRLLDAWSGTPFIIGVADQVPPDGDISLCRLIADMISG
ncbi:MAG: hypothetical protein BWY76_01552 [bacterium ADurb.Bin429]|nr:MAG: hypothetical protein BWY76_01552 [bacterium ADurb.Bin429]